MYSAGAVFVVRKEKISPAEGEGDSFYIEIITSEAYHNRRTVQTGVFRYI